MAADEDTRFQPKGEIEEEVRVVRRLSAQSQLLQQVEVCFSTPSILSKTQLPVGRALAIAHGNCKSV